MRLYELLPLIIKIRDKQASGHDGLQPILSKIIDSILQEEYEEHITLIQGMSQLRNALQVGSPYRQLLLQMVGQEVSEGWSEQLERFFLSEAIPWHKISGTVFGWEKTAEYRTAGAYWFSELFKTEPNEVGDYSPHRNAEYPFRAARVAITPAGLYPYDWSADTVIDLPPYIPTLPEVEEPEDEIDYDTPIDVDYTFVTENDFIPNAKLSSIVRGLEYRFGSAVAYDGLDLFIGEPGANVAPNDPGSAASPIGAGRVVRFRAGINGSWFPQQTLVRPTDTSPITGNPWTSNTNFGRDLCLSEDYLLVLQNSDIAQVYQNQYDGWQHVGTLTECKQVALGLHPDGFVWGVCTYGDPTVNRLNVLIESPYGGGFEVAETVIKVDETQPIALAVVGDTFLIGQPFQQHDGNSWVGQVQVFQVAGSESPTPVLVQTILPPELDEAEDNQPRFGFSLAVLDDVLVVGQVGWPSATQEGELGTLQTTGCAYVYERVGGQYGLVQRLQREQHESLEPFSGLVERTFGNRVLVQPDFIAVSTTDDPLTEKGVGYISTVGGVGSVTLFTPGEPY